MLFARKERRITRILVVEDEPLVAFDTEHALAHEGFEIVATLDTVAGALAVLDEARDIHLVLVDVTLTDGSGIDVAQAAHDRGVPVLFVTGECPGHARALAAGCLAKPYPQRDLLSAIAVIDRMIAGDKPPRRLPQTFSLFLEPAT